MIYRRFGRTNLNVSVIGLGGGVFNRNKDPSITLERAREAINFAVKEGINFIDMGKEYDEEFISNAMKEVREKIQVIARSESRNAEEMEKDIKDSIRKLKVKPAVYEIMVNSVEDLRNKEKEGVIDALKEAKLNGEIKFTGIFSHKIEVLKEAIKTNEFDVVMTLYNAVHRMAEQIFPLKRKYKFGFIAAAPFATGILVDPKYDENVHVPGGEFMTAENALKFILSSPYVDATMIGMKTPQHIEENVNVLNKKWRLMKKERKELSEKTERFFGKEFCRMCRYCEGCLPEVSIADMLKLLTLAKCYGYVDFVKWQYSSFKDKVINKDFNRCEKMCPYNLSIAKLLNELQEIVGKK
jgi:predicted aldo/keto reductase-like oxidoreductase